MASINLFDSDDDLNDPVSKAYHKAEDKVEISYLDWTSM